MGHALIEILEKWITGVFAKRPSGGEVTGAEGDARAFLLGGLQCGLMPEPPDAAVEDHAYSKEEYAENGPHDPAAFDECFDDDV